MTRRESILLRAFALWTIWVWGTRIWNILGDDTRSTGFKVVHVVLAVVWVVVSIACWWIVRAVRARQR